MPAGDTPTATSHGFNEENEEEEYLKTRAHGTRGTMGPVQGEKRRQRCRKCALSYKYVMNTLDSSPLLDRSGSNWKHFAPLTRGAQCDAPYHYG